ncbi:ATP-binding protein [Ktedonospora formicarum]|nr:ATP-binding protein [Ktedonospora formicarum]
MEKQRSTSNNQSNKQQSAIQLPTSVEESSSNTSSASEQPEKVESARMLHEAAQITAQSFGSAQEAISAALDTIGHVLNCQTLYLAKIETNELGKSLQSRNQNIDKRIISIVIANEPSLSGKPLGPIDTTYCQTILHTKQPLLIEDARHDPSYQHLPTTDKMDIGSYIGVPLLYSNGRVFGTLCSIDPKPRPLSKEPEKMELMQIVARFLVSYIEREELTMQLREAGRIQTELALKEQQVRIEVDMRVHELEAIFDSIGDGIFVCDLEGHMQMNAAAHSLVPPDFTSKAFTDAFAHKYGLPIFTTETDELLSVDQWPIKRVLRGEKLTGDNIAYLKTENQQKQKRFLSISGMPIYDNQNQISGGVLVCRDITEQFLLTKRTHETLDALIALAESLAWLPGNVSEFFKTSTNDQASQTRLTIEQLTQLICAALQCNLVGILVFRPETTDLQLYACNDTTSPYREIWWETITQTYLSDSSHLNNNEVVTHKISSQIDGNSPNSQELVEAPMFLGNKLQGILALIYKQEEFAFTEAESVLAKAVAKLTGLIIERERLLKEQAETRAHTLALQETNQRFNEFLSIASHELRGPLTAIKGNIQLAKKKLNALSSERTLDNKDLSARIDKIHQYLERSEHQISTQNRLVSDLLDVARIRSGKLNLHIQQYNLSQIVREVVQDQQRIAEDRLIRIHIPEEGILVDGDTDRLGQVVNNYLTNAIKYSPANEPIDVTVSIENSCARVSVQDRGPGLTLEDQEHIWERFYRAKNVQVLYGHGIGLGLGLHICQTIIEQHGGQVGLYSEPGKGSNFWFLLPLLTTK